MTSLLQHEKARNTRDLNERIAGQQQTIDDLQKHSEELQNQSEDTPDGTVTHVDSPRNTVWLNIGRKDSLRTQVTFSIYGKNHQGLANGTENVKAKIEVVELSETRPIARIVEEDRDNPIEIGDFVFSPVWSAGLKEHFAFVGSGDLNGDGLRDDRDRQIQHRLFENAGVEIDLEVTDEGVRVPANAKLTSHTKWLVVSDQDDSPKGANNPVVVSHLLAIQQQREALVQEAREHGIKIVSLEDFLAYLGWKPELRLFVGNGLKLKPGARAVITPTPGEAVRITDPDTTVNLPLRTKTEFTFPERITTVDGFEANILSVEPLTPQRLHITRVSRGDNEVVVTGESKAKYRIHVLLQGRPDLNSSAPAASEVKEQIEKLGTSEPGTPELPGELETVLYTTADMDVDQLLDAKKAAKALAGSVEYDEGTRSLFITASRENLRQIDERFFKNRRQQQIALCLHLLLLQTREELAKKREEFGDNHSEVEKVRSKIALIERKAAELTQKSREVPAHRGPNGEFKSGS